jgi:predicted GTPase
MISGLWETANQGHAVSTCNMCGSQVKARPPTFALFTRTVALSERTRRQLMNAIRRDFDFAGVPIRIVVRASKGREPTRK